MGNAFSGPELVPGQRGDPSAIKYVLVRTVHAAVSLTSGHHYRGTHLFLTCYGRNPFNVQVRPKDLLMNHNSKYTGQKV